MFIRIFRLAVLFVLLLVFVKAKSQALSQTHDAIEITPAYGAVTVNNKTGFFQDNLYGVDISYLRYLNENAAPWIKLSHAKAYGLSLVIRNLNNFKGYQDTAANSFGQAYGLAGRVEFQLLKLGNASINLVPAFGVSYITKNFFTNPQNRFIGSILT